MFVLLTAVWLPACSSQSNPGGPSNPPSGPDVSPPALPAVLVGAGDIAHRDSSGDDGTANLLDRIAGTVFTAGDNAYGHGSAADFREAYDRTWGRHRDRTYPTPGNHDYETSGASGYFDYFGDLAGPRGLGYYTYDVGSWRVFSLNSEPTIGQPNAAQVQWLRNELASRPTPCSIAIWHHPVFSSGPNGEHPHMREIFRILHENKVDVVINGHDHLYERFAPQDHNGRPDPAGGIRQFIVGTGGVAVYQRIRIAPNSERVISGWGVLKLTLHGNTYEYEFVPASPGGESDRGSGNCH